MAGDIIWMEGRHPAPAQAPNWHLHLSPSDDIGNTTDTHRTHSTCNPGNKSGKGQPSGAPCITFIIIPTIVVSDIHCGRRWERGTTSPNRQTDRALCRRSLRAAPRYAQRAGDAGGWMYSQTDRHQRAPM